MEGRLPRRPTSKSLLKILQTWGKPPERQRRQSKGKICWVRLYWFPNEALEKPERYFALFWNRIERKSGGYLIFQEPRNPLVQNFFVNKILLGSHTFDSWFQANFSAGLPRKGNLIHFFEWWEGGERDSGSRTSFPQAPPADEENGVNFQIIDFSRLLWFEMIIARLINIQIYVDGWVHCRKCFIGRVEE